VTEIAKLNPNILTVLMTGHGTIDSALEAMKQGASDISRSPLNLDEMVIRLQRVLHERQRFVKTPGFSGSAGENNQELRKIDSEIRICLCRFP